LFARLIDVVGREFGNMVQVLSYGIVLVTVLGGGDVSEGFLLFLLGSVTFLFLYPVFVLS